MLVELARWSASFPGAARALIEERSDARAAGSRFDAVALDEIATEALRIALESVDDIADDTSDPNDASRPPVDHQVIMDRASAVVDVVLVVASTRDRMAPVAAAEIALCLVHDVLPMT